MLAKRRQTPEKILAWSRCADVMLGLPGFLFTATCATLLHATELKDASALIPTFKQKAHLIRRGKPPPPPSPGGAPQFKNSGLLPAPLRALLR